MEGISIQSFESAPKNRSRFFQFFYVKWTTDNRQPSNLNFKKLRQLSMGAASMKINSMKINEMMIFLP